MKIRSSHEQLSAEEQAVFFRRKELLTDILFQKRPLEILIHEAAAMLKCPIILTTSSYRVIVQDDLGYEIDDPIWKRAKEFGYCGADSVALFESEGITRQVLTHENSFLLDDGLARKIPRILHKIKYFNKTGAYIGLFQMDHIFELVDFVTTDLLCDIISIMLERDPKSLYLGNEIRESILSDLLDGSLSSSTILNDRIHSACWKTLPVFQCALITPSDKISGIDNIEYLAYALRTNIPGAQILHIQEGLLLLMNFKQVGSLCRYQEYLKTLADKYHLYINISSEFHNLISLKSHFETCHLIQNTAKAYHIPDQVICFTDILFESLAEKLQPEERERFMQIKYTLLSDYDAKHNTNYCETLITYIECGCNSTTACSNLYIHRNTMAKRLTRITDICNININDGQELIHFYLTDKLYKRDVSAMKF